MAFSTAVDSLLSTLLSEQSVILERMPKHSQIISYEVMKNRYKTPEKSRLRVG